jgi:hypothetical protein
VLLKWPLIDNFALKVIDFPVDEVIKVSVEVKATVL